MTLKSQRAVPLLGRLGTSSAYSPRPSKSPFLRTKSIRPVPTLPGEPRCVSTRTDHRTRHQSDTTRSSRHVFSGSTLHSLKSTLSPQATDLRLRLFGPTKVTQPCHWLAALGQPVPNAVRLVVRCVRWPAWHCLSQRGRVAGSGASSRRPGLPTRIRVSWKLKQVDSRPHRRSPCRERSLAACGHSPTTPLELRPGLREDAPDPATLPPAPA